VKSIWYHSDERAYDETDPNLYSISAFPELALIETHWSEIAIELKQFIQEKDTEFSSNAYEGIKIEGSWSSITFMFWGFERSSGIYEKCPLLASHLKFIKGLVSISFSCLAPQSSITPHQGDTNAIARCHLGIEIPANLPICGLKVGNDERSWQEGKWVVFNDAYLHSAWNHSDKRRVLMIVDIMRPEYLIKKKSICSHVVADLIINNYLGKVIRNEGLLKRFKWCLLPLALIAISAYRPLRNMSRRILA
jgi:aspartyl/asparaginyl beta-hydroxylase (cupin superfamily)